MTSWKNALTTWPKMMGSETFIMVALRWAENRMPSSLARATWAFRNSSRAVALMNVASTTSPASTGTDCFSTVVLPSPTSWMVRVSSAGITTDCSLVRKSSWPRVATLVLESLDHAPMVCGCFLAYSLTALGARRSELPSRSTGFTAEPLTRS